MRKRSFYILLGATVVLVAAAGFAVLAGDRAAAPTARGERVFPGLLDRLDGLAWARLSRGGSKIDFANVAGQWVLVAKGNYPAAPAKIRQLFLGLADLALVEPKTARVELFGRLDLDDPANGKSTLIMLRDRTGNTVAELIVGKVRHGRLGGDADGIYIRKAGDSGGAREGARERARERAWLARGSLDLPVDTVQWLDRGIVDIPRARIASVTLAGGAGAALVLRRDTPGGEFAIADLPEGTRLRTDAALAELAGALAGLDLDDVRPAPEMDFPEGGIAAAEFVTFDGLAIKLRLIEHQGADWVAVAASGSGAAEAERNAINDRVGRWAYAIPKARARLLRTRLADLTKPAKGS